ncbi:MAG: UPF0280 family protein [Bacteroidales bacterium]|nr:UPF0280 family protein [Bacteroidales bacterium]
MYEPRTYRKNVNNDRFAYFRAVVDETDLWIGIEKNRFSRVDQKLIRDEIVRLREELKKYIVLNPEFQTSMIALPVFGSDPPVIQKLKKAGITSSTGPMSGVAGLLAEEIAKYIHNEFDINEIIVENGGDICLKIRSELNIAIDLRGNSVFKQLGIRMRPSDGFVGVCSSSGTFGHSISLGKADLLTVISHDTVLADAWATSLANQIHTEDDIIAITKVLPENVTGILAIKANKIGYKGNFKLVKLG